MLRTSEDKLFSVFITVLLVLISIGGVLCSINQHIIHLPLISHIGIAFLILALFQIVCYVFFWSKSHYLCKYGFHYAVSHARLLKQIKKELLEAGFYLERYLGEEKVAELPRIKINFSNNCLQGELFIQNHIKFNKKLEDLNISSGLGSYIVEQQFLTNDENFYRFEFIDGSVDKQLVFNDYAHFLSYCTQCGDYELFIDAFSKNLFLHHTLLAGQTGSGKSYALQVLILQMLSKKTHYNLYFCDPKLSGLAVLGSLIDKQQTATEIRDIIELLKCFHANMSIRMHEMKKRLSENINGTYADFGFEPHILLFDEFLAFTSVLETLGKPVKDEINAIVNDIVLKGRQLGFFIWLLMQQAPAKQVATSIRDNLVWKVVLGDSDKQTYMTAFGTSTDIPIRKFPPGYGVYTYSGLVNKPKTCAFPTINFDIIETIKTLIERTPVM